jgi:hypothetical protein
VLPRRRSARRLGRDIAQRPYALELRSLVGGFGLRLGALSVLLVRLHAIVAYARNRSGNKRKVMGIGRSLWTEGFPVKTFSTSGNMKCACVESMKTSSRSCTAPHG